MKRFLIALILALGISYPASAQTCNDPSGFLKSFGEIDIGDILIFGPTCQTVQSGAAAGLPSLNAVNTWTADQIFTGVLDGQTRLLRMQHAGNNSVMWPKNSGNMIALVTPQYIGFKCDGTIEAGIIQSSINQLPANGGVVYLPAGSDCRDSSFVTVNKPNVIVMGPSCVTGFSNPAGGSVLTYTGTNTRYFDARSNTGFSILNTRVLYSTTNPAFSILVDASSNNPGVTLASMNTFACSFFGPDTNRTGTATLIGLAENVNTRIDSNFFQHAAPAIKGAAINGQNTVVQVSKNFFSLSDTVPVQGCGETWIFSQNSFEGLTDGTGRAFSTTGSFPCSATMFVNNWFGDVTAPGATWIDGYFRGFVFTGNKVAGDLVTTQTALQLNISQAVSITGNDFDFLAVGVDCGSATTGGIITANKFGGTSGGTVTVPLQNPANCANLSAEGNSPSISRYTAGQILIGQTGADAAPKTLGGDATLNSAGTFTLNTVNAGVGSFGSATACVVITGTAKGLITALSSVTCTPSLSSVTGILSTAKGGFGIDVSAQGGIPIFAGGVPTFTPTNGSGNPVRTTSPALITPDLGTPTAINLANATNLPATALPNPSSTTLGGIRSLAAVAHLWINAISTIGIPSATQPAFTDISGSVATTQMPAMTGDCTTSAGAVALTCTKINGVDQNSAWTPFTPTVTCAGGGPPTLNAVATNGSAFQMVGTKTMKVRYLVQITANNGCTGTANLLIPNSKTTAGAEALTGGEYATGAWSINSVTGSAGSTTLTTAKYDGTNPLDTNTRGFTLTGQLEVQ